MEIKQTTREITDYHFRLDGDEMAKMLADPIAWADELRATLNYQTLLDPTPPPAGKRKGAAKSKRAPKGPAGRKSATGGALQCGLCDKKFKNPGWLEKHLLKAHPTKPTPTPESSPA